jgi:hypothetical protein
VADGAGYCRPVSVFVLLGEIILAASLPLLGWFVLAVIINAVYIPLSEEPGLVKRLGADYLAYKQNVPRWIPRLRAWKTCGGGYWQVLQTGGQQHFVVGLSLSLSTPL